MSWWEIRHIISVVVFCLILFYAFLVLYLYIRQKNLVFLPTPSYPIHTPKEIGIDFEEHFYQYPNGDTIHCWFIPAQSPTKTTILFCHGNSGNLGDRLEIIRVLRDLGVNLLLFDYRGYGASRGEVSENNTYEDGERMIEFLKEKKDIHESDIILYGRSLGGGVATELSSRHPNIKALILDSTFTSLPEIGQHYYPYIPVKWILKYRYDNLGKIKRIKSPKLIIHSQEDEVIPVSHAHKLYQAALPPKDLLILPKGGHNDCFIVSQEEYLSGLKSFLAKIEVQ